MGLKDGTTDGAVVGIPYDAITGAAVGLLDNGSVDGLMELNWFGCVFVLGQIN